MNTTNYKSFHYLENGDINFSIIDTIKTEKKLDAGYYELGYVQSYSSPSHPTLKNITIQENDNNLMEYVFLNKIKEIYDKFFMQDIKKVVNKLGYNHKLGLLLYGKQGTGKTSLFKYFYSDAIKTKNAIVFYVTDYENMLEKWRFIQAIREIQNNPIILFMDEIDEAFEMRNSEGTLKMIMDGNMSIDNCFFMAATNYIEKIPKSLTERPSRFKYSIEVEGVQEENVIVSFLDNGFKKAGIEYDFLNDLKDLKGKTIDELKEFLLDKIMNIESVKKQRKTIGFKK